MGQAVSLDVDDRLKVLRAQFGEFYVDGATLCLHQAAAFLRAAYGRGYTDGHADAEPLTVEQAGRLRAEMHARLPVS